MERRTQKGKDRIKVRCPECLAPIFLQRDIAVWAPVTCPECHAALEVTSVEPITLGYMLDDEDSNRAR